jgi:hypothetical protein
MGRPLALSAVGPTFASVSSSLASGVSSGLAALQEAVARAPGVSAAKQAGLWQHALRTAVRALQACLGNLPDDLQRVLKLSTGIDTPALSPVALAETLHVTTRELAQLERIGLRRLVIAARAHECGAAHAASELLPFSSFGTFANEEGGPVGGVDAARYAKEPSPLPASLQSATRSPSGTGLLGLSAPAAAGGALLVTVLGLAGVLALGLLSGAPWELHRKGRSRWIHRHPWSWHG